MYQKATSWIIWQADFNDNQLLKNKNLGAETQDLILTSYSLRFDSLRISVKKNPIFTKKRNRKKRKESHKADGRG